MDTLHGFAAWAWERHHNPLSWYIRPLFLLPFCYFAYKRSVPGMLLTLVALASSMFWFPKPAVVDPQAAAFLDRERQYLAGGWTLAKVAVAALVPLLFLMLAWAFWQRSWTAGFLIINLTAASKVFWSFFFGQESAWSLVPPAVVGLALCNAALMYAYRRIQRAKRPDGSGTLPHVRA